MKVKNNLGELLEKTFSFIENKNFILAATSAAIAVQVPKDPFGANLYLTIATYGFALAAFLNHLFPEKLHNCTHVVKAFYTQLIYASIGFSGLLIVFPLLISLIDLKPIFTKDTQQKNISEWFGVLMRFIGIGYGFFLVHFNPILLAIYVPCTILYYSERSDRIKKKHRHLYSWSHNFEHIAVFTYFLFLNFEKINIVLMLKLSILFLIFFLVFPAILLFLMNIVTYSRLQHSIPSWFDKNLHHNLMQKMRGNIFNINIHQYLMKFFSPAMINKSIKWDEIEHIIDSIDVKESFDVAVGIYSGGAFITKRVCEKLGINSYYYFYSKNWSRLSFFNSAKKAIRYLLKKEIFVEQSYFFHQLHQDEKKLQEAICGKRLLLIDDSVCSGATIKNAIIELQKLGAAEIQSYALFSSDRYLPDYYHSSSRVPMIWPWGFESD